MSSDIQMVGGVSGPASIDTQALKEPEPVFSKGDPPEGHIFVKKSFQTTEDMA